MGICNLPTPINIYIIYIYIYLRWLVSRERLIPFPQSQQIDLAASIP